MDIIVADIHNARLGSVFGVESLEKGQALVKKLAENKLQRILNDPRWNLTLYIILGLYLSLMQFCAAITNFVTIIRTIGVGGPHGQYLFTILYGIFQLGLTHSLDFFHVLCVIHKLGWKHALSSSFSFHRYTIPIIGCQ